MKILDYDGFKQIITKIKKLIDKKADKTNVVTSVNNKKGDMMVDFFIGDDTRYLNYAPKDYLEHGARYKSYTNSQFEFKRCTTVGVDRLITQDYCIVNTQVPWADKSGGYPMQIAYGKGVIAIREGVNETTWSEWQKVSTTDTVTTINGKTGAITKADIVALGIPSVNTTYSVATQSRNGLLSAVDKKRLDNIKEQVALTESQYNALSSAQQNDDKKIYFIKA